MSGIIYPENIDDLPPLRDVIAAHDLRAEKKLGQNFLLDQNITDKIARAAAGAGGRQSLAGVNVFEIGPGPGGLTRSLLRAGAQSVTALEFDARAIGALESLRAASGERLDVLERDALAVDLLTLGRAVPRMVVANLPYNIATPLLIGWLKQIRLAAGGEAEINGGDNSAIKNGAYEAMVLMFQREVAERIVAPVGGKAYGRLAVMSQWLCEVKICFDLPPQAFTPPPKIKSSVVRFVPRHLPEHAPDFDVMEAIVAAAFGQRRKMIRSSMKAYMGAVEAAGIAPDKRAEALSVADYLRIASFVSAHRSQ